MMHIKVHEPRRYEGVEWRVQLFALAIAAAFGALVLGFWRLQVVHMAEFSALADENRVRSQRIASGRGIIEGRDGTPLAQNRASADVVFVPGEAEEEGQVERVAALLGQLLDVPRQTILDKAAAVKNEPFRQITIKRDITKTDRIRIEEHTYALPGVTTVVQPQRRYPHGRTAGQLLGYLGEINQTELDAWDGYNMGDLIGRAGLERQYEDLLHGTDGYMLVTKYAAGLPQLRTDRRGYPYIARVDSLGQILEEEGQRREPIAGQTLRLTLDIALQAHCEAVLGAEAGSIVVLDADTGGLLALASTPTYDPGAFVTRSRREERLALLSPQKPNPMLHRAFRENYPPGSVYKVLLAAAALEDGIIDENTSFYCPGHFKINGQGRSWHCWRRGGHGSVSVEEALAYSCDVFFYNVGLKLGVAKIVEWSNKLGFGIKTGIDLPGENKGLVPGPEWKAKLMASKPVWDQKWYPGDTVNLSIGQGSCASTPLQCAVLMAAIVNDGFRVRPYLNAAIGPEKSEDHLGDRTIAIVEAGMRLCVADGPPAPSGTGHASRIEDMDIIGKTGSAQVVSLAHHEDYASEEDIPYHMREHAWFVAGVLDRTPRIAVCILVEHGLHGSSTAAPLAKQVIEFFYEREAQQQQLMVAQDGGTR